MCCADDPGCDDADAFGFGGCLGILEAAIFTTKRRRYVEFQLYRGLLAAVDLLFPPRCASCKVSGARLCQKCLELIELLQSPICEVCGEEQSIAGICRACQKVRPCFSALRSWAAFSGPLQDALHRLKYQRDISLGEVLAKPLAEYFVGLQWTADLVIPIPLSPKRYQERGYNQAAMIAWPFAMQAGLPYNAKALRKVKETRTQVGLDVHEREANVRGAFEARRDTVAGKCVLLVDDVTTSGATLDAAAKAVLEAGARSVFGLTVARARHKTQP